MIATAPDPPDPGAAAPPIAFVSFDVFPAPKGASVHIEAFARTLGRAFGALDLVTLGSTPSGTSPWLVEARVAELGDGVTHHALPVGGGNMLARALSFRAQLARFWGGRRRRVVHVRSIFEGYPLAVRKGRLFDHLVFEVNGLPSIELKYHYPRVAEDRELLLKLERQERACLAAADLVITPSEVTAAELERRGTRADDIVVIPNGVDPELFRYRDPPRVRDRPVKLLYTGTMTSWQGVHHALEAVRLLRRDRPCILTLVGPLRRRQRQDLEARLRHLDVADSVTFLPARSQSELAGIYHAADAALVPLPFNDRNCVQGCCPLKLLEAMAAGVPVVATELPVVRALAGPREAVLVKPGSGKALKDGILAVLRDHDRTVERARAARARVEEALTWDHAGARLVAAYCDRFELAPGVRRESSALSAASSCAGL